MKKPSQDLFDLVKTLNAQEIKQFRQQLRLQESNTSLFFEHLVQADTYSEAEIRSEIFPTLNSNRFSVAKHYLYNTVLMLLMQRDQQLNAVWKIRTRLQMFEVLFQKELFLQCKKLMTSIERAARQLDDPSLLKEIYLWRLKLADRLNHAVSEAEFMDLGTAFLDYANRDLELSQQLWLYHDFFFRLRKNGVLRAEQQIGKEFKAMFEDQNRFSKLDKSSFAGQLALRHAQATFYFMKGAAMEAYQGHLWIAQSMEANSGWIALRPDIYLDAIFRLGVLSVAGGRFEELKEVLHKMEKLKQAPGIQEGRLFFYETQLQRLLYLLTKDWANLGAVVAQFEAGMVRLNQQMSKAERMVFQFNNAMALISFGDFQGTKRRLVDLLNTATIHENLDIEMISKLLLVLIAEHERDLDSFKQWYRAVYRLLRKKKEGFELERLILSSLAKVFKVKKQNKRVEVWTEIGEHLAECLRNQNARAIQYFDFVSWINSKATGKSFEAVFKAKIQLFLANKKSDPA